MPDQNGYYNTLEAGEYLGVSDRTVRTLCETRQITHERLNNRNIRFKKEWLDAYLDSIRVEAQPKQMEE